METEKIIRQLIDSRVDYSLDEVPEIDLYMDQVTTLLNKKFDSCKRNEDDRLLTKTMINNYTKAGLLPSPEKKKYSKDHIIVLIMIYFFKNMLSIQDTNTLIRPAVEQFFHKDGEALETMYNQYMAGIKSINDNSELLSLYEKCAKTFDFHEYENSEYLETLAFVTVLSYQASMRQQLVIKLIDRLSAKKEEAAAEQSRKDRQS